METSHKSGINATDFFQTKPTSQSRKQFPPTLQSNLNCSCRPYSAKSNSCSKCKQLYPLCCTQIFQMCLSCRARFHDPVNIVEKPLTQVLFDIKETRKMAQTLTFVFDLDSEVADGYGVQVRCFKPQKEMIQFPMLGAFYINDKLITTLKPLFRCSNLSFRKDNSFFIDRQYLKQANRLKLEIAQCRPEYFERFQSDTRDQSYFLGIYYTKCQTFTELTQSLNLNSSIDVEQSISAFFKSSDFQQQHSQITIKLQCPYSLSLIKIPARGGYCRHFQTFCLETLYKLYSEKRKWDCPICGLHMHQIVIDNWVLKAINNKRAKTEGFSVRFLMNGSWQWRQEKGESEADDDESSEGVMLVKPSPIARKTTRSTKVGQQIAIQQRENQKQRGKPKNREKRKADWTVCLPPQKQPTIIVIKGQEPPRGTRASKQLKEKERQEGKIQKPFRSQRIFPRQEQEQILIPIMDFQSNKDKASRMLTQLWSQFESKSGAQSIRRKCQKQLSDDLKKVFSLS